MVKVGFTMERETKNTVRFAEIIADEQGTPKIGTIYIPKTTLDEMGWTEGQEITIALIGDCQ